MASTTPKLDRIISQFKNLMGEPASFVADTLQAADVLSKAQVESYISKAMFKLFNQYWQLAIQNIKNISDAAQKFLIAFPELSRTAEIAFTDGEYPIATPNLDFFFPYGAMQAQASGVYARILDSSLFQIVQSGVYSQYTGTAEKPILIYMDNKIFAFPAFLNDEEISFDISFIKKPVIPETGDILRQNGGAATPDSPFSEHWETLIAEYADQIYREERQIGRN